MSYNSIAAPGSLAGRGAEAPVRSGWFSGVLERFIASREAQARRAVANHLAGFSDERLRELGFSAEDIAKLRTEGRFPASYWL